MSFRNSGQWSWRAGLQSPVPSLQSESGVGGSGSDVPVGDAVATARTTSATAGTGRAGTGDWRLATGDRALHSRPGGPARVGLLALALSACGTPDLAEPVPVDRVLAGVIEDESALFGGTAAEGQVGDVLIQNSRVRFVVQAARDDGDYYESVGGGIIDADIARPDGSSVCSAVSSGGGSWEERCCLAAGAYTLTCLSAHGSGGWEAGAVGSCLLACTSSMTNSVQRSQSKSLA